MINKKVPGIKELTDQEKITLAGELWDEVMTEDSFELTEEQKDELNKRIKFAEENPDKLIPWEKVKSDLSKKYDV